jgi:hypothetical protein
MILLELDGQCDILDATAATRDRLIIQGSIEM